MNLTFADHATQGEIKMKTGTLASLTASAFIALLTTSDLHARNSVVQIITIDAPGAGTGVAQGTGCFGCTFAINQWGVVVGTYLDANNVFHAFVRSADGKITTYDAPGADT